jgi:processive 1,2-diacylglycerol beta-glucosyltransferase
VEIFGWTDRIPELMSNAHLLISKAGGATVQESLAALTPLVVTQIVPGQEEGNARLLLGNNCGALAPSTAEIVATVQAAFADEGALWKTWCSNIARLRRPDAARDIAQFVLAATPAGYTAESTV